MTTQLHFRLLPVLLQVLIAASTLLIQPAIAKQHELPITLAGCPDKCGNISIPFPFGMKPDCFRDKGFEVICNDSFNPPRAFLPLRSGGAAQVTVSGNDSDVFPVELIGISIAESKARAYANVASFCNTNATDGIWRIMFMTLAFKMDGPTAPLLVSLTDNVLVAVGVEVQPLLFKFNTLTTKDDSLASCRSTLIGNLRQASNGSCSGRGCCQASLPQAIPLTGFSVVLGPNNNSLWETSPCSFAMVVGNSWYNFSTTDLYGNITNKFPRGVPYVIDFAIRNSKCPAKGTQPPPDYACVSGNSSCAHVTNGYVCKCMEHYEGNPYIPHGCQDIDECELPDLYPCSSDGICKNRLLGYDCPCKPGMKGDGKAGTCQDVFPLVAKMVVGVIGGFIVAAASLFFILLRQEKKKMSYFYEKNGGPILEKAKTIKLFKKEELQEILRSGNLIGKGCFGEVYKGVLDNKLVAVKKPISGSVLENDQFANEVIIQSQIIHKNIVRLIGCCLEVDIPMLVYEFINKGNLEDILHSKNKVVPLNLDVRVSIAAQSAEGLAYMHSKTNNKILHGDVKPANILLDDNFMPKISDFGISRLIARDKQHTDAIIGDKSYMDPVYKETGLLTEKSDVYSFGVVILELISRKKATYSDNDNLVRSFLKAHKQEKMATELFDVEFAAKSHLQILDSMARIAVECLNDDVYKRPSMMEVAERLLLLKRFHSRP